MVTNAVWCAAETSNIISSKKNYSTHTPTDILLLPTLPRRVCRIVGIGTSIMMKNSINLQLTLEQRKYETRETQRWAAFECFSTIDSAQWGRLSLLPSSGQMQEDFKFSSVKAVKKISLIKFDIWWAVWTIKKQVRGRCQGVEDKNMSVWKFSTSSKTVTHCQKKKATFWCIWSMKKAQNPHNFKIKEE